MAATVSSRRRQHRLRNQLVPWLWLSPALLLLGVYLVYPVLDTLRRSVLDARSEHFVGLDNYRYIVENPQPLVADTHSAILNNLLWLVLLPAFTVVLGLAIAVLAGRVRYEAAAKSAIFIPMAISFVAASVIWRFVYEYNPSIGTLNAIITGLGGHPTAWIQDTGAPQRWLTGHGPATLPHPLQIDNFALAVVGVWMWTGFAVVILSAGLKGISREILEAARVDGASEWQIFWRIIVPSLTPTMLVVGTTMVIQALKLFDLVWVMTGGRFDTDVIATLFFRQAFLARNAGVGSALAVLLLVCVLPITVIALGRLRRNEAGA